MVTVQLSILTMVVITQGCTCDKLHRAVQASLHAYVHVHTHTYIHTCTSVCITGKIWINCGLYQVLGFDVVLI